MDKEDIMLSEIKSDGERQIFYDFAHMWNLKTRQKTKQNKIHRYRE